jgi:hypothetical protein
MNADVEKDNDKYKEWLEILHRSSINAFLVVGYNNNKATK